MNASGWLVWGIGATLLLTGLMAGGQYFGLTRMSIPYMLGTMVTPSRDKARLAGIGLHLCIGLVFSLAYVAVFEQLDRATWWIGTLLGLFHALIVCAVLLPALPGLHPRMAGEQHGPTVVRYLEPPGFFGLHYGVRTPLSIVIAHLAYGAVLGGFYLPT